MDKSDYIRYVEQMLDLHSSKYSDSHLKYLYERGYLVSILTDLMMHDSLNFTLVKNKLNKK